MGGSRISDIRRDPQEHRNAAAAWLRGAGPGLSGIAPGRAVRGGETACEKDDHNHEHGTFTGRHIPREGEREAAGTGFTISVFPLDKS